MTLLESQDIAHAVVSAVEEAGGTAFRDCRGEWHLWIPDDAELTQPRVGR